MADHSDPPIVSHDFNRHSGYRHECLPRVLLNEVAKDHRGHKSFEAKEFIFILMRHNDYIYIYHIIYIYIYISYHIISYHLI